MGMRTPSRVKRARYNVDIDPHPSLDAHHEQQQQQGGMRASVGAGDAAKTPSHPQVSILTELEETRRLVKVFDVIDNSMTEAREKLKVFYKTADETNTLLDMWIRVLSQTEHTQKLLQDPEEARDREHQERRAAYHLAMEEATRPQNPITLTRHSLNNSNTLQTNPSPFSSSINNSNYRHLSSSINATYPSNINRSQTQASSSNNNNSNQFNDGINYSSSTNSSNPLKKSSSALAAAAHAHASAIAANRKRNAALAAAAGSSSGGGGGGGGRW
ncbi:hypothetical protein FBU30_008100 [Linnemannia zychae]|nr:hypothetical protein FBU30_008100 [Linnemannia zychae]